MKIFIFSLALLFFGNTFAAATNNSPLLKSHFNASYINDSDYTVRVTKCDTGHGNVRINGVNVGYKGATYLLEPKTTYRVHYTTTSGKSSGTLTFCTLSTQKTTTCECHEDYKTQAYGNWDVNNLTFLTNGKLLPDNVAIKLNSPNSGSLRITDR